MCELFQVDRALVDNPQGNIDILIGTDACGLLLKDQDVPRTPFMRDLNISKSALSDFLYIKGAAGEAVMQGRATMSLLSATSMMSGMTGRRYVPSKSISPSPPSWTTEASP